MTTARRPDELEASLSEGDLILRLQEEKSVADDPTLKACLAELDTLESEVRNPATPDPFVDEPELRAVMDQMRELPQVQPAETMADLVSAEERPAPPPRMLGQYQLLEELGSGGMGTVFKALHTRLDRVVAIKVLPPGRIASRQMLARFDREMRSVGKLRHPAIVEAKDAGEIDGTPFLVMELVDGCDLGALLKRMGRLPIAAACELIRQAALGLQHIADQGLVHRDIKPSNLMLAQPPDGGLPIVKILDLGLAVVQPGQAAPASEVTSTGQVIGTLDYMAPEQAVDLKQPVDIRADIYSLGATLFKLLTGHGPIEHSKNNSTMKRLVALERDIPAAVSDVRPDCPAELSAFIARLLAKSPDERPARPADVATFLQRFSTGADLSSLLVRSRKPNSEPGEPAPALSASNSSSATPAGTDASTNWLEPTQPQAAHGRNGTFRNLSLGAAACAVLALAAVIIYWETPDGVVRIESDDPAVQIAFDNDELKIVGAYKEPISLTSGQHGLRIQKEDFAFSTDKLVVEKGDQIALKIEFLPGKVQVVQAGKGVLDSQELPARTPVNAALERSVPQPVVPREPDRPFVLVRSGGPVRAFKSLSGILAETQDGDVIEIRSAGPHPLQFEPRFPKSVHLRAAPGVRPLLVCRGWQEIRGSLVLDGLDIDQRDCKLSVFGERYELINCRVLGWNLVFGGPRFAARDSILLTGIIYEGPPQAVRIELENNLIHESQVPVLNLGNGDSAHISLTQNSFYKECWGSGSIFDATNETDLHIAAEGNLFHVRGQSDIFRMPDWRERLGKTLHWEGRNNLYSGAVFRRKDDPEDQYAVGRLEDWNKLLGQPEEGAKFVEQVVPLFAHLMEAPLSELRPHVERVLSASRRRQGLLQLGPDLDLVGPGAAYLKVLQQEGRAPAELRPEVPFGGSFVVIRAGQDVAAYPALQAAADAAADGDIIEIRKDGDVGGVAFLNEAGRTITLRAGPGYRPVVAGVFPDRGADRLILEGLTLAGRIGSVWDPQKNGFTNVIGGIHRVINCEVSPPIFQVCGRFVAVEGEPPSIQHSRIGPVAYLLAKDTALRVQNSVLLSLDSGNREETGLVEIDRSMFWYPEPRALGRALVPTNVCYQLASIDRISVRNTYHAAPMNFAWYRDYETMKQPPFSWHCRGNVYAVNHFVQGNPAFGTLASWKMAVEEDENSIEEFPPMADPSLWKLVPGTPGAGQGPDGRDHGADVSRIVSAALND